LYYFVDGFLFLLELLIGNWFLGLTPVRENFLLFVFMTHHGESNQAGVKAQIGQHEIFISKQKG